MCTVRTLVAVTRNKTATKIVAQITQTRNLMARLYGKLSHLKVCKCETPKFQSGVDTQESEINSRYNPVCRVQRQKLFKIYFLRELIIEFKGFKSY